MRCTIEIYGLLNGTDSAGMVAFGLSTVCTKVMETLFLFDCFVFATQIKPLFECATTLVLKTFIVMAFATIKMKFAALTVTLVTITMAFVTIIIILVAITNIYIPMEFVLMRIDVLKFSSNAITSGSYDNFSNGKF